MLHQLDLLLVTAPSRSQVYQSLADEFAAIEPPVWSGLIAQHVKTKGFSVEILDAEAEGLTVEETAQRIVERNPRLAAYSIYGHQPSASTQCLPAARAVALHVKNTSSIPQIAFGTHPSALPERTLREEPFDFVLAGEGASSIVRLLRDKDERCEGMWSAQYNFKCGPGLRKDVSPPIKRLQSSAKNLDSELPSQAWDLLNMTHYRAHNWHLWTGDKAGGYASVQTSLGCPFKCSFCCINAPFGGPGIRYWSPENVVNQITTLVERYGITNIKIPDEMFVLNRQHVLGICDGLINAGLAGHLNMWAYARIDTVRDNEVLAKMREAGFRWLGIGIESGSKHVRDGVAKGKFDDEDILQAIERVHGHGLHIGANYIFGLPDDTEESMRSTEILAHEINAEWANMYCAMPYPGSALHRIAGEHGWQRPEDPGGPGWIGYSQHSYNSMPLPTETLPYTAVLDFRDAAFLRYYARGEYLKMLSLKFGFNAVEDVAKMLSMGMPRRAHREQLLAVKDT